MKIAWAMSILVFFSSGCSSLDAVRDYSGSVQATVEEVKPVAQDFYDSCKRTQKYRTFTPDDLVFTGKEASISDDEDADLSNACDRERTASKAIGKMAMVLQEYASALGALASDNLANYNSEIDSVANELKGANIKGLDENKINSVSSLVQKLSKAVVGRYQQKQVEKFIKESHPSVVNVSNALADVLETNYLFAMDIEGAARSSTLKKAARIAEDDDRLGLIAYIHHEMENQEDFWEKQGAVKHLVQSVRQIGETHAELEQTSSELSGENVKALAENFKEKVIPVIKEVQDAF